MARPFVALVLSLSLVSCSHADQARVDLDVSTPHGQNVVCTHEVWTVTTQKDGFRYLLVSTDPHRRTTFNSSNKTDWDRFIEYEKTVPSYGSTIAGPLRELGLHQFHSLTSGKDFDVDIVEHYEAFDAATNRFRYFCGNPS